MSNNIYDRESLSKKTREELLKIASTNGLGNLKNLSDQLIIENILKHLEQEAESSAFVVNSDDNSSFVTNDDQSSFVQSNDDESSSFVQQEEDGSSFVNSDGNDDASSFLDANDDASAFINEENQASAFQSIDETNSSFLNSDNDQQEANIESSPNAKTVHNLGVGDYITLNGQAYLITKIISSSSREAVIYQIKDGNDKLLALKLYREHKNKKHEPNSIALSRIKEINDPDILKLHDFGTGDKKYQGKYCFEISDFALGGNLLDSDNFKEVYSPEFIEQTVIDEIFKGIKMLHEKKIFHCDLKPQNIFYLQENETDLVIGDYGSSKTFEEGSDDQARQFGTVIATHAYMAPEQGKGIISEKADYYAFGMILLHLLYPEYFARDNDFKKIDNEKVGEIVEKQYAQKPIINFNPKYQRINELIGGLTLFVPQNRWGKEEVEKWLKREPISVRYQGQSLINPVNVNYPKMSQISSPEDLIFVIYNYPDRWYDDLIEDAQGFKGLLDWVYSRTDVQTKRIFEQMILYYRPDGKKYVQEAIMRYFHPDRPFLMGSNSYQFYDSPNLKKEVLRFFNDLDLTWKKTPLGELRYALFQMEFALRQAEPHAGQFQNFANNVIEGMRERLDATNLEDFSRLQTQFHKKLPTDKKNAFQSLRKILLLIYFMNPKRGFKDLNNQELNSLEEMGLFYARNESLFDDTYLWLEKGYFLANNKRADLVNVKYEDFLFGLFQEHTQTHITLGKLKVDQDRNFTTTYTYKKSLSDYLKKQKIPRKLMEEGKGELTHKGKKGVLQTSYTMFNRFLKDIQEKHKLPDKVLNPSNINSIRNKFILQGVLQNLGHHATEGIAAAILLLPLLGAGALYFSQTESGLSIAESIYSGLMAPYIFNSEENFNLVQGFYPFLIFFGGFYLISLIPKLWAGKRLEILGYVSNKSSKYLTISGGTGFAFIAMMTIMPFIFAGANWLWELFGAALLFGVFIALQGSQSKSGGKGRAKRSAIGILILLTLLGRLAFEIWAGTQDGFQKAWENEPPYRGGIDYTFYIVSLFLFFIPTIYTQYFKAHNTIQLLVKTVLIGALAGLFISQNGMSLPSFSFDSFFAQKENSQPYVPNNYLSSIKDRYNAVNFREGKSSSSAIIRPIEKGERFLTISTEGDTWWKVTTCEGLEGYMFYNMIDTLGLLRQDEIDNFLQGTYPCGENAAPPSSSSGASNPIPVVNYEGKVGRLNAAFNLNQRNDQSISGKYHYPDRNPQQVYLLSGQALSEGRMELIETTNGKRTSTSNLTYNKSQRCYVGKMSNTDGRKLDIRICGNQFNHPAPEIPVERNPAPEPEQVEAETSRNTGIITGSNVNIRSGPTTLANNIITKLQLGDEVIVLERKVMQSSNDAMLTKRKTTLTTLTGEEISLDKGKAVTFEKQKGNQYMVSVDLGNSQPTIGYIRFRDLRPTAGGGEEWFKIRFSGGEGWVFGEYLSQAD